MRLVLAGTDGSPSGEAALHWAADLAGAMDAELVVAGVWRPTFAEVSPEVHDELEEEARVRLEAECRQDDSVNRVRHRCILLEETGEDDVRRRLLEAADKHGADLVVVGAPGAGTADKAELVGSVTHELVHHADRPIAAVPDSTPRPPGTPHRIVVGVDGSDGDAAAVDWAHDLAERLRADVSVVVEDDLAPALAEAAVHDAADLVVVGTSGLGRITKLRLDSNATKAVDDIPLPTVLVPPRH
ncbi:MAG TPA: universal stress protein [Acidimicrobiia bacterium]|jgi:nucleotide-binding universal stress UspA family protein